VEAPIFCVPPREGVSHTARKQKKAPRLKGPQNQTKGGPACQRAPHQGGNNSLLGRNKLKSKGKSEEWKKEEGPRNAKPTSRPIHKPGFLKKRLQNPGG